MSKATQALQEIKGQRYISRDNLVRIAEIGSALSRFQAVAVMRRLKSGGYHPWVYQALFISPDYYRGTTRTRLWGEVQS